MELLKNIGEITKVVNDDKDYYLDVKVIIRKNYYAPSICTAEEIFRQQEAVKIQVLADQAAKKIGKRIKDLI